MIATVGEERAAKGVGCGDDQVNQRNTPDRPRADIAQQCVKELLNLLLARAETAALGACFGCFWFVIWDGGQSVVRPNIRM